MQLTKLQELSLRYFYDKLGVMSLDEIIKLYKEAVSTLSSCDPSDPAYDYFYQSAHSLKTYASIVSLKERESNQGMALEIQVSPRFYSSVTSFDELVGYFRDVVSETKCEKFKVNDARQITPSSAKNLWIMPGPETDLTALEHYFICAGIHTWEYLPPELCFTEEKEVTCSH